MNKTKQNDRTHSAKDGYNHWPLKGAQQTTPHHRNHLEDGISVSWKTPQGIILMPWPWGFPTQWRTRAFPHRLFCPSNLHIPPPLFSSIPCSGHKHRHNDQGRAELRNLLRIQDPLASTGWKPVSHGRHFELPPTP